MIVRADEVPKAEAFCRAQRRDNARTCLRVDKRKAAGPADVAMCERVAAAAAGDFAEFENLLRFPEVTVLFQRGALFYRPPTPRKT
jgi:hypothetical protein